MDIQGLVNQASSPSLRICSRHPVLRAMVGVLGGGGAEEQGWVPCQDQGTELQSGDPTGSGKGFPLDRIHSRGCHEGRVQRQCFKETSEGGHRSCHKLLQGGLIGPRHLLPRESYLLGRCLQDCHGGRREDRLRERNRERTQPVQAYR